MTSSSQPQPAFRFAAYRNWKLRTKLWLAFGLMSLLVLTVTLIAFWGFRELRTSVYQAMEVDGQLSRLANNVAMTALQVRRYEREYFLDIPNASLRNQHLARWQQESGELFIELNNLEVAMTDADDRRLVQEWQAAYSDYRAGFDRLRLQIETGVITTPEAASAALDPTRENIALVADQAVLLAERKDALVRRMAREVNQASDQKINLLLLTGALALAASIAWGLLFPASLTRPISALSAAAERFSAGDLSTQVDLQRNDELGTLATGFNTMAATIKRQLTDLEAQFLAARTARDAAQAAEANLAAQLQTIEAQRAVIAELSVPILPLAADTLIMPLVGALDTNRLNQLTERALHTVEQTSARYLILDITGVPLVDTQVAAGLVRVIQAVKLLGAQVVLVGVRPEVAQAVVGLGVTLGDVVTRSSLQSGVEYTTHRLSRQSRLRS